MEQQVKKIAGWAVIAVRQLEKNGVRRDGRIQRGLSWAHSFFDFLVEAAAEIFGRAIGRFFSRIPDERSSKIPWLMEKVGAYAF